MNNEKLLKSFKSISSVPVCIYSNKEFNHILEHKENICLIFNKMYTYVINQKDNLVWIDGLMIFYKIEYQNQLIILGPSLTYLPSKESILSSLLANKMFLTNEEIKQIIHELMNKNIINYFYFKECINMLSLIYTNKEYIGNDHLIEVESKESKDLNNIENIEIQWSNQNIKYVHTLEYYVQNGMVDELIELFKIEQAAPYGTLASTELRHYKNSMMVHIYIIRKAAAAGGLDEDLCLRLAEAYSQQCEAAMSIQELTKISQNLRLDYCIRVKKIQTVVSNNLTITKAIKYIHDHRMEKIDAKIIANHLGVSSVYLCSEFKKEIGESIVSFIHKEKLKTAKKMLIFSDYSLNEISSYLAFSSQNYFQSIFKKYEGVTPIEFKRKNQKDL